MLHELKRRTSRLLRLFALSIFIFTATGCLLPASSDVQPGAVVTIPQAAPIIAVAPLVGEPGTYISISGSGWQPGDEIEIRLASIDLEPQLEETFAGAEASEAGTFSAAFPLPTDAKWQRAADLLIVAQSAKTTQRVTFPFQVRIITAADTAGTSSPSPRSTPTSIPQSTPEATPTTEQEAAGVGTATVTSLGLNMRRGPSISNPIVRAVSRGTFLTVLGQNSDGSWLLVRTNDGTEGWVSRFYTDYQRNAAVARGPTARPASTTVRATRPAPQTFNEWRAEYYTNRFLNGYPALTRNESSVGSNWGNGSPAAGIPSDNFSARWVRSLHFDGDDYRFHVRTDDGVRLYVDNSLIIDQWRDDSARDYAADIYLGTGTHTIRIEYYEHTGTAELSLRWEHRPDESDNDSDNDDDDDFPDWKGEYYTNRDLDGDPRFRRNDEEIDFNWGDGSPGSRIPDHNFSVRWTKRVRFDDDRYRFFFRVDDGVRFYIDSRRVLNEWHDNLADNVYAVERDMDGRHDLKIEYYEHTGGALIEFWWERVRDETAPPSATPTPTSTLISIPTPTPTGSTTPTATQTATATPSIVPTLAIQPSANVDPGAGGRQTSLRVYGGGFPAGAMLNVHLGTIVGVRSSAADQTVYAVTTTDRTGSYAVTFEMPVTWPDGTTVADGKILILVATEDFGAQATTTFDYVNEAATATPIDTPPPTATPTVTHTPIPTSVAPSTPVPQPYGAVQPSTVDAGELVTVSGGGFTADTQIGVYLGLFDGAFAPADRAITYASTITDAAGAYTMSFVMPDEAPDGTVIPSGRVVVLVATADFALTTSALLDYTAPEVHSNSQDQAPGTIPQPSTD